MIRPYWNPSNTGGTATLVHPESLELLVAPLWDEATRGLIERCLEKTALTNVSRFLAHIEASSSCNRLFRLLG